MNKLTPGAGSASAILVFMVLCLTVFTLITYLTADSEMALVRTEARMVKGYYEADALAECIVAELGGSEELPASVKGVRITVDGEAGKASFSCRVTDKKELYVELAVSNSPYSVLAWRMRDSTEWGGSGFLPVWPGY